MPDSPTSRTLKRLRKDGWTAAVTERWNPHAHIRQDLFGFIDVLAIHPERGTLAIQATSGSNLSKRVAKIRAEANALIWLHAGRGYHQIEVWAWRKLKVKRRGKAIRWVPKIQEITANNWWLEHEE